MNLSDEISLILNSKLFEQNFIDNKYQNHTTKSIINATCINTLYTVLRDIFKYKPKITPEKFQDRFLYSAEKISMLIDVLNLCDKMVNRK